MIMDEDLKGLLYQMADRLARLELAVIRAELRALEALPVRADYQQRSIDVAMERSQRALEDRVAIHKLIAGAGRQ